MSSGSAQKAGVVDKLPLHLKELYERSGSELDEAECEAVHHLDPPMQCLRGGECSRICHDLA